MMSLLWRNRDDYKCTSGRIIVNELDRSLLNPYPSLHLFHLHHQFLFQALQKTLSTFTWGPENPPSKSRMILSQLQGIMTIRVTKNSLFEGGLALPSSTTGKAGSIGVLWSNVEIVDQWATVHSGAGRGWLMTRTWGFGIPTNLERFDLERGQCYEHVLVTFYLPTLFFDMHELHVYSPFPFDTWHFMLTDAAPWWLHSSTYSTVFINCTQLIGSLTVVSQPCDVQPLSTFLLFKP